MLSHLTVKNVALIDHIELTLQPGLTVVTGETGAGKSILVEALLLLLGQRASADVVRSGASEGVVEAQFCLSGEPAREVSAALADYDLPPLEDGTLVLRRVVSREGRHKQQVNGALCTVAQLKAVAEPLVDFTGQHAHQQLLRPAAALPMLDGFAGADDDVALMGRAFSSAAAVAAELAGLRLKEAEKERRLDVLRFYLDEIDALSPQPGEDQSLEIERRRLANASRLRESLGEVRSLLGVDSHGDDDALTKAQQALTVLKKAERDDATLSPIVRSLDEAVTLLDDVARSLARHGDVDDDPARLLSVEDRLDALKRVMKKHGGDVDAVLRARQVLLDERVLLDDAASRIGVLELQLKRDVEAAAVVADRLSAVRTRAAVELARAVEAELPSLGMQSGRIEVRVEPLPFAPASSSSSSSSSSDSVSPVSALQSPSSSSASAVRRADGRPLTKTGGDRVELLFTANAGEPPAPLSKVASGGELSRVLLAVKRVLLAGDPVPVSVFDEVDAGVGGAVGEAIGEKLEALAAMSVTGRDGAGVVGRDRQVLCITHLPQIACRGDGHLVVEKGVASGRTVSRVREVSGNDRVDELSRMLGGKEISAATVEHARDMLERAHKARLVARAPRPAAIATTSTTAIAATLATPTATATPDDPDGADKRKKTTKKRVG